MRKFFSWLLVFGLFPLLASISLTKSAFAEQYCPYRGGLGLSRIIEIDPTGGPKYGRIQYKNTIALKPKEVILTFDDGPYPKLTDTILKTLDKYCVKATFFPVGSMARAYPAILRRISGKGHTIGAHTHSHPMNLRLQSTLSAIDQIEHGFLEVQHELKYPISPFFRFPGLNDSKKLNAYLAKRNIANISVDIVPGDTDGYKASQLVKRTLAQLKKRGRGIILMHDIKPETAKALPHLLTALKKNGYKVAHIVATKPFQVLSPYPQKLLAARKAHKQYLKQHRLAKAFKKDKVKAQQDKAKRLALFQKTRSGKPGKKRANLKTRKNTGDIKQLANVPIKLVKALLRPALF